MGILSLLDAGNDIPSPSLAQARTHATLSTTSEPFVSVSSANPTFSAFRPSMEQSSQIAWTSYPESTTTKTFPASTPSVLLAGAESPPTDHTSKTWQTVGIVITAVFLIAIFVTCAMFFDRLCRFLKDIVCCTSQRPPDPEQLITSDNDPSCTLRRADSIREEAPVRGRELPWDTSSYDWNPLYRPPTQKSDHTFIV